MSNNKQLPLGGIISRQSKGHKGRYTVWTEGFGRYLNYRGGTAYTFPKGGKRNAKDLAKSAYYQREYDMKTLEARARGTTSVSRTTNKVKPYIKKRRRGWA